MTNKSLPLHLKYRPKDFDEFMGSMNKSTIESLKAVLEREKGEVRAFLFIGPSGCGKTTLARIIKEKLDCSEFDFKELNAANVRGIDTIRDIASNCQLCPLGGKVRIYLFDEVHQVTKDAQNAMLKLLEDTPEHVRFILCTTDPEKLLKTLRNRCTTYEVKPLRSVEIKGLLEYVCEKEGVKDFPEKGFDEIAKVAEGSPRKALVILDKVIDILDENECVKAIQEVRFSEAQTIDLCRALMGGNWETVKGILKNLDEEPEKVRYAILGYLNKALLSGKNGWLVADMIHLFSDSFMYTGKAGLSGSCYYACNKQE